MKEKTGLKFYPPYHHYVCECDPDKELTLLEMIAHAKEKHGADINGVRMKRNLMLHISRSPRHSSTYKWEGPGFNFFEYYG